MFVASFIERADAYPWAKEWETQRAARTFLGDEHRNSYYVETLVKRAKMSEAERRRLEEERWSCECKGGREEDRKRSSVVSGMRKYDRLVEAQSQLGSDLWRLTGASRISPSMCTRRRANGMAW
jgi:hypothetical protein